MVLATTPLLEYMKFAVNVPVPPESVTERIDDWPKSKIVFERVKTLAVGVVATVTLSADEQDDVPRLSITL